MIIDSKSASRLGLFFIYDADGVVDEYVLLLLNSLRTQFRKLVVISNGNLNEDGYNAISNISDSVIIRENQGFDSWAYKAGIDSIGWNEIVKYDELIMFNFTIMGPVNSFDRMFEVMNSKDLDFWGITKHHGAAYDSFGNNEYGYLPEHIQSHFIAVRKSLLESDDFQSYWDNLPEIKSYADAVNKHEAIFTKKFADKGFLYDVYVQTDDLKVQHSYPLLYLTKYLVEDRYCPIFKKRMFTHDYSDVLNCSRGNLTADFFSYLSQSGKYDVNLIWDTLLRTGNQEDLYRNLKLNYILDSNNAPVVTSNYKLALVMHLYYQDMFERMIEYAEFMPSETDIYITVVSEESFNLVKDILRRKNLLVSRVKVMIIENRGRDVSSTLVSVKDVIMNYDLACFIHDKKTTQLSCGVAGAGFADLCYSSTVESKEYILNVIKLFADNPRLGIAVPPFPKFADFFGLVGHEWGPNFEGTKKLADELNLKIKMRSDKLAIAPYGTCFWYRPVALKKLYDYDWNYGDFPQEPNNNDGTLLHYIERLYPYVVQDAGYYPAIVMSNHAAEVESVSLEYYLRSYNVGIFNKLTMDTFINTSKRISGLPAFNYDQYNLITRWILLMLLDIETAKLRWDDAYANHRILLSLPYKCFMLIYRHKHKRTR